MPDPSIFDRLSDPASYTGVYAERFRSGSRINADSDCHALGASRATSGHTSERSGRVVQHLSQITRQNLNVDRDLLTSPSSRAAARARARLDAAEAALQERAAPASAARGRSPPRAAARGAPRELDTNTHLRLLYSYYCRSGRGAAAGGADDEAAAAAGGLDGAQWARLMRDCPALLDGVRVSTTSTDLVFAASRDRATRRLGYMKFLDALAQVAIVKYDECEDAASAFSLLLSQHVFRCAPSLGITAALADGTLVVNPPAAAAASEEGAATTSGRGSARSPQPLTRSRAGGPVGGVVALAPHLQRPHPPPGSSANPSASPRPTTGRRRSTGPAPGSSSGRGAPHHARPDSTPTHRLPPAAASDASGFTATELSDSLSALPVSTFLSHPSVLLSSTLAAAGQQQQQQQQQRDASPVQAYLAGGGGTGGEGAADADDERRSSGGGYGAASQLEASAGHAGSPSAPLFDASRSGLAPPGDVYEAIARKARAISLHGPEAVMAAAVAAAAAAQDAHEQWEGGLDDDHDGGDARGAADYGNEQGDGGRGGRHSAAQQWGAAAVPPSRFDLIDAPPSASDAQGRHAAARSRLPLSSQALAGIAASARSASVSAPAPASSSHARFSASDAPPVHAPPVPARFAMSSAGDASPPPPLRASLAPHSARGGSSSSGGGGGAAHAAQWPPAHADEDEDEPAPPAWASRAGLASAPARSPGGPELGSALRHPHRAAPTPGATTPAVTATATRYLASPTAGAVAGDSASTVLLRQFASSLREGLYASSPPRSGLPRGVSPTSLAASPPRQPQRPQQQQQPPASAARSPRGSGNAPGASSPRPPPPGYGEPGFQPTLPGAANTPGGVYDRLSSPRTFTGVYKRAYESDGRMNASSSTMVSALRSSFRGHTNAASDEVISDIGGVLRPNLRTGRNFH